VPQIDSCRFAEKFHWPLDMVLIIGFGITPTPTPTEPTAVKVPLVSQGTHADLLVIIENKGPIAPARPAAITRTVSPTLTPR